MAAEFKKKASITTSIPLSSVKPDVYEGNKASTKIGGSKFSQSLLNRFTIPSKPTYGDANLKRLDASFYVSSLNTAAGVSSIPEAALYKTKNPDRYDLTEGAQETHPERSDIIIFTSRPDEFASITENFNGSNTAGYDATEYIHSNKMTIQKESHYIWPKDLYRYGAHASNSWYQGYGLSNEYQDYSKSEIRDKYGVSAAEFGEGVLSQQMSFVDGAEKTLVVPVKLTGNTPKGFTSWGKDRTVYATADPIEGKEGKELKIFEQYKSYVKSTGKITVEKPDSPTYGDEITPANSMFEMVQGDTEYFGDSSTTASQELLATATVRFNTAKYLTGGQSAEMKAFWSHSSEGDDVKYAPKGKLADGSTSSAANLQECKMVKKNIPFPIKHPAKPSFRAAEQLGTGQDANMFANNLEIDINIGALALANEPSSGTFTLKRAFIICFSHEVPDPDDDFFTFAEKHADSEISYTSNDKAFMDTSTTNDSTVKPFSYVAFINDADKGILMVQPASVFSTGSTTMVGQHTVPMFLNNSEKAVTVATGVAANHAVDLTDRWVRLNFLFQPQTYSPNTAGTANGNYDERFKPSTGSGRGYGAGGGTHCVMIMSDAQDGTLIKSTMGGGSTEYPFFELNNVCHESSTAEFDNWPRHLSLWVTNSEGNATGDSNLTTDVTTDTRVYIDKIEFKDFNYEIENPNVKDFNLSHDAISIAAGKAFIGADGIDTSSDIQNWSSNNPTVSAFRADTPTTFVVGAKNPKKLGYVSGSGHSRQGFQSDLLTSIMLQDFRCANLAQLAEIPDSNMIATYSYAGGDELEDDGSTAIVPTMGQNHTTHYGLGGFLSNTNTGAQHINSFEGSGVDPHCNIMLKDFSTGMLKETSETATQLTARPDGSDDSVMGKFNRTFVPFRIGDTLVVRAQDNSDTQRSSVITNVGLGETEAGSDNDNDYEVTVADSIETDDLDQMYVRPEEGTIKNWTAKGVMTLNLGNSSSASTTASKAFSKRECSAASARVLEIQEISDTRTILKVDTLKPLRLDQDEEFIVYLYGQPTTSADWTRADNSYDATADEPKYSQCITSELDSTCDVAKASLKIDSIDDTNNCITLTWNGKAEDGSTVLAKYDNIPILMISPYRYWGYINIDVKDSTGVTLPPRSYGSFSVVKNQFARWDGTYFENDAGNTLTVNEAVDATEVTLTLNGAITASADFNVGTFIGLDDEICYINAVNSTTEIQVVRGVCETYVSNPTNVDTSTTPDRLQRTAPTHSTGVKVKKVKVHWANGDEISGNLARITSGGNLDTKAERQNLGSTYNENPINYTTVSNVPAAYSNTWAPSVVNNESIFELLDFGFGAFDDENSDGGYLAKDILKTGQYNQFKCFDISKSKEFDAGKTMDLLLKFRDDTIPHTADINTRHAESNTPFVLAVFEDDLPNAPKLKVAPSKDPFNIDFTWTTSESDLWYGFLVVDELQIANQYHTKYAHIPFNEDSDTLYLESQSGNKNENVGSEIDGSKTEEGLAGFARHLDGSTHYAKFSDFTDPTTEMSINLHIIPDDTPSGDEYLIYKYSTSSLEDYSIYLDSSKRVNAKVYPQGQTTNPITLQSGAINIDGETPTNIILTVDTDIVSGNVKLFIDGKLVDQSGLVKSTHTVNNWKANTVIKDSDGALYIGAKYTSSAANFYDGRIEEIVVYPSVIYPVVPSDGKFTFTKPIQEVANGTPVPYNARLFIKDYHNIRGKTTNDVAASANVSFKKAGFRLV